MEVQQPPTKQTEPTPGNSEGNFKITRMNSPLRNRKTDTENLLKMISATNYIRTGYIWSFSSFQVFTPVARIIDRSTPSPWIGLWSPPNHTIHTLGSLTARLQVWCSSSSVLPTQVCRIHKNKIKIKNHYVCAKWRMNYHFILPLGWRSYILAATN